MSEINITELYSKIQAELARVIVGKGEIEKMLMLALLAEGHVLIEGLPGTAKTKLSASFARAIGIDFKRIQFTPDMMPADVTGFYLYSPDGESRFVEGPIFSNIVLADELNRTTPRTQSALLEAMQENQVTIEGKTYALPDPFMVIATQVHAGGEGTYPLTDVQSDRFLLRVISSYSSKEEEKQILANIDAIDETQIDTVTTLDELKEARQKARQVQVSPEIVDYIVSLTETVREDPDVQSGPSIRASIAIFKCARVLALMDDRDFVIPDDVKELLLPALGHRIKVRAEAEMDDITPETVIRKTAENIPVPKF